MSGMSAFGRCCMPKRFTYSARPLGTARRRKPDRSFSIPENKPGFRSRFHVVGLCV